MKTVFSGENGIKEYLNPSSHCTPIVELPSHLNPYRKDGVRIFLKLTSHLPLMNIKSIPIFHMLEQTDLSNTHTVVENSSGNTAYSLAVLARLFGINDTIALVSHEITRGKFRLLQLFGVDIIVNKENICPNPADKENGIIKAKRLGQQPGWLNLGQYDNPLNIQGHEKITAPQLYQQMNGEIQIFASSLGTTGSFLGNIKYLKSKNANIVPLGVVRKPNNPIPGPRTKRLLQHIKFPRKDYVDIIIEGSTRESYLQSMLLLRNGILVGPSSGLVVAGIFSFVKEQKNLHHLDAYRNKQGEINIIGLCGDTPFPYIEEYFKYLPQSCLPNVKNAEYLPFYKDLPTSQENIPNIIQCKDLFKQAFTKQKGKVILSKQRIIYDIRTLPEYQEFHIPGAIHHPLLNIKELKKQVYHICIVCTYGMRSYDLLAKEKNPNIYTLKGGMIEWSALNLPREKNKECIVHNK